MRTFSKRGLIAAAIMAIAMLAGNALPASADTGPDGLTILYADDGDLVHDCVQIGTDQEGYDAVVCVDIDTYGSGDTYYATGEIEAYCQDGSAADLVNCDSITIDGIFANQSHGGYEETTSCSGSACGGGRFIYAIDTFDYTNTDCTTALSNEIWAEAAGDTQIDTPGGGDFTVADYANDGDNYSTDHYWVCP
jgi:hypothetical protein